MDKEFVVAYDELNDEQQQAVDALEGPVLVVAGPGTGKTQLLSTRVANILKSTDTRPANVLCLTYTNKAAINMKQRIIRLAGPEGSKLPVKTFHSFAGEIMNLYPDYFWNAARLSVASDSVQLEIIEAIISQLPLDNPLALKFAGQYTLLSDIRRAIGLAKDAGLTPAKLRAIIEVNLAYLDEIEEPLTEILDARLSAKNLEALRTQVAALPQQPIDELVYPLISLSTVLLEGLDKAIEADEGTGKTTNTGAWKKHWLQTEAGQKGMFSERRRDRWWLELAGVYASYLEQMHERGFYDYADMLVEVITQLEQHPEVLADLQEHFNYVLIDEFQDTTPAQLRLAHLVADHHSLDGQPNLMVVGDDDQAIYKFSGAELNNMLGFRRRYPGTKQIILVKNYRSTQAVLDTAKQVIGQAENRLVNQDKDLSKDLLAENPPEDKGSIRALSYTSRELQLSQIARDIKAAYKPNKEIAVLARGHDSLVKMAGILQQLDVPVRYEQQSNILEHDIINQVYLLAQLLDAIQTGDNEAGNALIHQIIRHPMWGLAPETLWQLAVDNHREGDWLKSLLMSEQPELKAVGDWFVWLASQAANQPLAITLEYMIGLQHTKSYSSPLKKYFVDGSAELANQYFHSLSAIQLLRALVHDFAKTSEPTLAELIRFIEINRTNGLVVADESPFITGNHAVQLLTVHKAKGLEFDAIYIIDAVEDNWRPKAGGRRPPANLPLQPAGDDLDDYVRLMYVALTRAKSSITVSAYHLDHAGKDVAVSPIIQSAFDIRLVTETDKSKLVEVLEENLRWPDLGGGQEQAILKARLETYSLSVTHLLNFLNLEKGGPRYFKERNLLRLPEAKSVNLAYGTAMHSAMETAQKLVNNDSFELVKVTDDFSKALASQQLAAAEYQRFNKQGEQVLARLFNDYGYRLPKGSLPEQDLRDIQIGPARLRGKLDRVDLAEGSMTIVDYKTGKPLSSFETRDKNSVLKAHNQKLQLIFYALLASQQPSFSQISQGTGQMVYLEADDAKQLIRPFTPSTDDIDRLKSLIAAVWQHIMALDFPDTSSYEPTLEGINQFEDYLINGTV